MRAESEAVWEPHAAELHRIKAAYGQRDEWGLDSAYRYDRPGFVFYEQLVEWAILSELRRDDVDLASAAVLDIGCGTGDRVARMRAFGAQHVHGVDLVPTRIEAARSRYPDLEFVCANAADLSFADGSFAVVTQFVCLSSVLDPDLRSAIAAEMWRVLAPGGVILSYDLRPEPWPLRLRRERRGRRNGLPQRGTPTIPVSAEEIARLFPGRPFSYRSAALDFELCAVAARSPLVAQFLARLPALRTHGLAVVRKPLPLQDTRRDAADGRAGADG